MAEEGGNTPDRRTMCYWLARTARETRESVDPPVKTSTLAVLAGVDASTISRFEAAKTWPQKIDRVVAAYAAMCGIEDGRELWARALKDWRASGGAPALEELGPAQRALLLAMEAAQRKSPYDGESQSEPNATQKKRRTR